MDNQSSTSSTPPPSTSQKPSESPACPPDYHNNDGSPMRKKPRLDSATDATPASDQSTHSSSPRIQAPVSPSARSSSKPKDMSQSSPSKVTLNLRSPNAKRTNDEHPNARPSISANEPSSTQSSPSPVPADEYASVLDASTYSLTPQRSPPVVDITLDDDEGYEHGNPNGRATNMSELDDLMRSFPFHEQYGLIGAVKYLVGSFDDRDRVPASYIHDIGMWFAAWVRFTESKPQLWHSFYSRNEEFWLLCGQLFYRIVFKRYALTGTPSSKSTFLDWVNRFVASYVTICMQFAFLDHCSYAKGDIEQNKYLEINAHSRHLRNLCSMWQRLENPALWKASVQLSARDLSAATSALADKLLNFEQDACDFFTLASDHVTILESDSSIQDTLLTSVRIINHALDLLFVNEEYAEQFLEKLHGLQSRGFRFVQKALKVLTQMFEKHSVALDKDFTKNFIDTIASIWQSLMIIDHQHIAEAFSPWKVLAPSLPCDIFARVQATALLLKVFRSLILRGRMELRVLGAYRIGDALSQMYNLSGNPADIASESVRLDIRQRTAEWLIEEKVIEQVVAIDSHPGVIQQSGNILSYLVFTHTWTKPVTDAIFNTLHSSQDARLTSAILDLMRATLHNGGKLWHLEICMRTTRLPLAQFTPAIVSFMHELLHYVAEHGDLPSVRQTYMTTVDLLGYLTYHAKLSPGDTQAMFNQICSILSQQLPGPAFVEARCDVCKECVRNIQAANPTAGANVRALEIFLSSLQTRQMLTYAIHELDAPTSLSAYLIKNAAKTRGTSADFSLAPADFGTALKILVDLMIYEPSLRLENGVEAQLLQSLVGSDAVNERYREDSWHILSRLCKESPARHDFVERFIQDYLPSMGPDAFTLGLVEFIREAISYKLRVDLDTYSKEGTGIQIPLQDYLWDVILEANIGAVADLAMKYLCGYLTQSSIVQNASVQFVEHLHDALVEKAIEELESCSEAARQGCGKSESDPVTNLDPSERVCVRFTRTIKCLQMLLEEAQRKQRLVSDKALSSAWHTEPSFEPAAADSISLKFQQHPPGGNYQTLSISRKTSYNDLYKILQRKTRFPSFKVYWGGRILDLQETPDEIISTLPLAALLVKSTCLEYLLPVETRMFISNNTASRAVFARFDRIYKLLELPMPFSLETFCLSKIFPPFAFVADALKADTTDLADLFSARYVYKTLYTLNCIQQITASLSPTQNGLSEADKRMFQRLFSAFTNPSIARLQLASGVNQDLTESFITCMFRSLRICETLVDLHVGDSYPMEAMQRINAMFENAQTTAQSVSKTLLGFACDCVVHLSRLNILAIEDFIGSDRTQATHEWLLLRHPDPSIRYHFQGCVHLLFKQMLADNSETQQHKSAQYWELLLDLVPRSFEYPTQSALFYQLLVELVPAITLVSTTAFNVTRITHWLELLVSYRPEVTCASSQETQHVIIGICRLVSTVLRASTTLLGSIDANNWNYSIFNSLLFPPVRARTKSQPKTSAATASVLDSEARKQLCNLMIVLCQTEGDIAHITEMLDSLSNPHSHDELTMWEQDRTALIRSSTGYSGLRNLTNTCYMNSLLTQLFMNIPFRDFMTAASVTDRHESQKLLHATQELFAAMLQSQRKYADTETFAASVKPYDAPVIDVTIQMDVDEFYNLLFEQWEDQLTDKDAKTRLRSIYGGHSVTQIKSLDCEHVSERVEEYLTVSCEVKGKHSLEESLQAFISGDFMEGDNKYKCESCGDRYVNAVKRSCLKDVPDHLAFHLKRFDFDLLSLQRCKIHDLFVFPQEIDMSRYTYDAVAETGRDLTPDIFELVGVLVHSGSAEAGHYYSYIQDRGQDPSKGPVWLEFNDTDVTLFDPSKIPENCFGGSIETDNIRWPKPYCAYMLFYERKQVVAKQRSLSTSSTHSSKLEDIQIHTEELTIARDNDLLMRQYCLMDPSHAIFLRSLLSKLQDILGNTKAHEDHDSLIKLVGLTLDHLHRVISKTKETPEFDSLAFTLESVAMDCSECCGQIVKQLVTGNPDPLSDMLLRCPNQKARIQTKDLLLSLLKTSQQASAANPDHYGIDFLVSDSPDITLYNRGCYPMIINCMLRRMNYVGQSCRFWNEWFTLLISVADMGRNELAGLLTSRIFEDCLTILYMCDTPHRLDTQLYETHLQSMGRNRKFATFMPVLKLTAKLIGGLDVESPFDGYWHERLSEADYEKDPLPVTWVEHELIHMEVQGQYPFVSKCLEASHEVQSALLAVQQIVASMLMYTHNTQHVEIMHGTVIKSIREYYHNFQYIPLALALPFCQYAPGIQLVKNVLDIVELKTKDFEQLTAKHLDIRPLEFSCQNGDAILQFFLDVGDIRSPQCYADDEYPLQTLIRAHISHCAPRFLLFDSTNNRDNALNVVQDQLLRSCAQLRKEPVSTARSRIKSVVEFIRAGIRAYNTGRRLGVPRLIASQLNEALGDAIRLLQEIEVSEEDSNDYIKLHDQLQVDLPRLTELVTGVATDFDLPDDDSVQMEDEGDTELVSSAEADVDADDLGRMSPSLNGSPSR